MCEPDVSVVAFDSKDFNILKLHDEMTEKGWNLNALQNPTG
jgi:sphinganine-1-phosphate aldolase